MASNWETGVLFHNMQRCVAFSDQETEKLWGLYFMTCWSEKELNYYYYKNKAPEVNTLLEKCEFCGIFGQQRAWQVYVWIPSACCRIARWISASRCSWRNFWCAKSWSTRWRKRSQNSPYVTGWTNVSSVSVRWVRGGFRVPAQPVCVSLVFVCVCLCVFMLAFSLPFQFSCKTLYTCVILDQVVNMWKQKLNWINNVCFLPCVLTVISVLQGTSEYEYHRKVGSKVKKSTDVVLPSIRRNIGGAIANEQNTMDTCVRHKGMCCGNLQWIFCPFEPVEQRHHFLQIQHSRW